MLHEAGALEGEADPAADTIDIFVPLSNIGARKGSKVAGHPLGETGDVEVHLHTAVTGRLVDDMTTTKTFKI